MTPRDLLALAIDPALTLLPTRMDTTAARAMLLAVALQESGLQHRTQIKGPAKGFWQFESIGVRGVQQHHASAEYAAGIEQVLCYQPSGTHQALEHNDVLAAAYARLLLWQSPRHLPNGNMDESEGWRQYLALWRPGQPRPENWHSNYATAWDTV